MKPSSYILFARRTKGTRWTPYTLRKKFLRNVDKGDYDVNDQEELFKHLYKLAENMA